jgi:thiol:disulfide interchange protein DsbD
LFARHFFSVAGLLLAAIPAYCQDLLDPEVAFRATARLIKPNLIEVRYQTAPGYYLYRDRLAYMLEPAQALLGKPNLPAGKTKHDKFFGKQVIYRNLTIVTLPVATAVDTPLTLTADLQGCADLGVCYPPVRRQFTLSLSAAPGK